MVVVVVFGGHGQEFLGCWVDAFAPEGQSPVGEGAIVLVHVGIFDYDGPFAYAWFAPEEKTLA